MSSRGRRSEELFSWVAEPKARRYGAHNLTFLRPHDPHDRGGEEEGTVWQNGKRIFLQNLLGPESVTFFPPFFLSVASTFVRRHENRKQKT